MSWIAFCNSSVAETVNRKTFINAALLWLFVCLGTAGCSKPHTDSSGRPDGLGRQDGVNTAPLRLMLAAVEAERDADFASQSKVDAALNLVAGLADSYELVTLARRDSLVALLEEDEEPATARLIAERLAVDGLLFLQIGRIENVLRVGLTIKSGEDYAESSEGVGWALIRYRQVDNDKPVFDPALLRALQRAFADAEGKPDLFAAAEVPYDIAPAQPLVVGGIAVRNDSLLPGWKLFSEKVVVSYDAVLSIIDEAMQFPRYVVYDIDSRDSAYARNNLHMAENYHPPTVLEIETLQAFAVTHFITGSLERNPGGALLTLQFCAIENGRLRELRSEATSIVEDSRQELQSALRLLTGRLLEES